MKRLLFCTPSYITQGGVERILEGLHRLLPARGYEVVFGLAHGGRFHDPERYRRAYPGIQAVDVDGTSGSREGRLRGLRRALRVVQPDMVVVARLFDTYQVACEWKVAGRPLRLASLIQAFESEYFVDARRYGSFLDLCVTGGKLSVAALTEWAGLPAERVCSIPGGVAPPARQPARDHHRLPLRLGYVGRFDQVQKRIRDLPEVLAGLARRRVPFEMHLIGSGPEEAWLRRRVDDLNLAAQVFFHGWQATETLYERVYPNLDLFVHLAEWEGAPIALTEGLLHGIVPVTAHFTGCQSEGLFRHGVNALVFPVGAPDEAAEHVAQLHADRGLLARLSAAATVTRSRVLSMEGMADAWAAALAAAFNRPPARGERMPALPLPKSGLLDRLGLSPYYGECLRRLVGKRHSHQGPGGEWPHWSGLASGTDFGEINALARALEAGGEVSSGSGSALVRSCADRLPDQVTASS